ncbi:hypothetical protein KXS15_13705 [Sinorhizobium meliloti]|uniref:hypothetical protein n=1 Tax=Rhizobium meliloti TaxID=382 RepID=UPI003F188801
MSDSNLHSFPVFETRPAQEFIDRWRQHTAETGSPETFTDVSTTKPKRSAAVILLSEEIRVPTPLRAGGEKVPCPLCSPTSPKFGTGRMAYFPDDRSVRFIGHRCAKHYLGDNYTDAERLFRIEAKCTEYINLWPKLQEALPRINDVVLRLHGRAKKLSELRSFIDVQSPGFATFLYRDLVAKGGRILTSNAPGAKTIPVEGLEFLSEDFNPEIAALKISTACRDVRLPLPEWKPDDGENDASKEIMRRGKTVTSRLSELAKLRDSVHEAARFLKIANLRHLEQWRASGLSPMSIMSFKWYGEQLQALAESYAGRFEWSIVIPKDLLTKLPTKEEVEALTLGDVLN